MQRIRIGDRFKIKDNEYILCRIEGLYYLVNLNTGETWTDGLTHELFIEESKIYEFEKIK